MEINVVKELQGALEERGLKVSQAEAREILKGLEDTVSSIYQQMEVKEYYLYVKNADKNNIF